MWRATLSVAVVLAIASTGCSGGTESTESSSGPLSSSELGWLRGYADWSIAVYNDELGPRAGARLVEVCRDRYDEIGPTPTERLERAAESAPDVCALLDREETHRRALDGIDAIDALLLPFLRDEQSLELATGVTES